MRKVIRIVIKWKFFSRENSIKKQIIYRLLQGETCSTDLDRLNTYYKKYIDL